MKMKRSNKHTLSLFLCMVLVVAMTLFTTGCNGSTDKASQSDDKSQTQAESQTVQETVTDSTGEITEESVDNTGTDDISTEATVLGEGAKQFAFTVIDGEGKETVFTIHTDKELVGEALIELALIEGEDGPYGLYVKTVNGITMDYEKDKAYWAFYVNGEYATSGVDTTEITEGDTYSFKVEK